MKKVIILLVCTVLISGVSMAQGLRVGVKAGANLNKFTGKSFNDGFDLSYHAGAFMEIDFNKVWGIQPELLWSQTSGKPSNFQTIYATTITNPTLDITQPIKLDYLTIPLLLRVNVTGMFSLLAGPQYSILLNQDNTLLRNGQDAFKNGDFALAAGAQINLKFLRIYGRYNIGLQNVNDIDSQDKWKSQQLQFGLGFRF